MRLGYGVFVVQQGQSLASRFLEKGVLGVIAFGNPKSIFFKKRSCYKNAEELSLMLDSTPLGDARLGASMRLYALISEAALRKRFMTAPAMSFLSSTPSTNMTSAPLLSSSRSAENRP